MSASVLIVDDHPILLQGCRRILEDIGIKAIFEARDVVGGYRLFRRHSPDMTIVDLSFQGSSLAGLALIQRIKRYDRRARVLVLSMHSDPIVVSRALHAGAMGYIIKDTATEDLVRAIECVLSGQKYLSDELARKMAFAGIGVTGGRLADLRARWVDMSAAERAVVGPAAKAVRERLDAASARVPKRQTLSEAAAEVDPEQEAEPEAPEPPAAA